MYASIEKAQRVEMVYCLLTRLCHSDSAGRRRIT